MDILNKTELTNVIVTIDAYNDDGLDTFSQHLTDYCEELDATKMDDIVTYIEEDLRISTDADLKEIDESKLEDLHDYINNLFN